MRRLATLAYGIMGVALSGMAAMAAFGAVEREAALKASAEISSQEVCLGDLVEDSWLRGRCALDRRNCCRWSLEGRLRKAFPRAELQRDLDRIDFGGIRVKLIGSAELDSATVTQTRRELGAREIEGRILSALASRLGPGVSVKWVKAPLPVLVPLDAEGSWDVAVPESLTPKISVRILSSSDPSVTLGWAQAEIAQKSKVYVARRAIRPTEKVSPEDFELKPVEVTPGAGTAHFEKDRFPEGVRARVTIPAGSPLTGAMVERVPIVRLGDIVTLVLRSDSLRIATKGVVQGAAAVGDTVTVQLQRYNRSFRGKLLEGRQVEVWF